MLLLNTPLCFKFSIEKLFNQNKHLVPRPTEFRIPFILINYQVGRQWENQVCRSLNEAENWFRSDEWADVYEDQEKESF